MHSKHLLLKPPITYVEKAQQTLSLLHRWEKLTHDEVAGMYVKFIQCS